MIGLLSFVTPAADADTHDQIGPPYEKLAEILHCGERTFATCTADGEFDPADGTIDLALSVQAGEPVGAGRGHAIGVVWFVVEDNLVAPVEELTYAVDVEVTSARASVTGVYANTVGVPARGFAFAEGSAFVSSETCGCGGPTGNVRFVSALSPGVPTELSDATFSLRAGLQPDEGDPIPAGPIRIAFLFHARVELGWSVVAPVPVFDTGQAALTFDAQVTSIRRVA